MFPFFLFRLIFTGACGGGIAQPICSSLDCERSVAMSYAKDEGRSEAVLIF